MFSFTVNLSKRFPSGPKVEDVLTILHDPEQVFSLSDYVISVQPDPIRGENHFITKERVPLFAGIHTTTTLRVKFTNMADGYDSEVEADLGTRMKDEMRVREDDGVVVLTEDATFTCLKPLKSFIKNRFIDSHIIFHEKLIEKVLSNMNNHPNSGSTAA